MKTPRRQRQVFLLALLVSLLAHLLVMGRGVWQLPQMAEPLPQVRELTARLEKLEIADAPPAPPAAAAPSAAVVTTRPATPPPAPPKRQDASAPLAQAASAPAAEASAPVAESPLQVAERLGELLEASGPAMEAPPPQEAAEAVADSATPPPGDGYIRPETRLKRFPDHALLRFEGYYGQVMVGTGSISWQREGRHYKIESRLTPIIGPALRYEASGRVDKRAGLLPERYQAWRNDTPREHAQFDRDAGVLRYGDREDKETPLEDGAQDVLSLGFQLALQGADLGRERTQITTGKKVYFYPLQPMGEADFDTEGGKLRAVVVRAEDANDVNEYWLAADFANLPVRIVRRDDNKSLEMRIVEIQAGDQTLWKRPPRPRPKKD